MWNGEHFYIYVEIDMFTVKFVQNSCGPNTDYVFFSIGFEDGGVYPTLVLWIERYPPSTIFFDTVSPEIMVLFSF